MVRWLRYFLFCIPVLASWLPSHAQKSTIDSLLKLIRSDKEDTNKVNHLISVGWKLQNNDPDTSIILSKEALLLSQKLNFKPGQGKSIGNIGVFHRLKGDYKTAIDDLLIAIKIDEEMCNASDKKLLQVGKKGLMNHLGNLGIVFMYQGNYPKALEFYLKALKIAEETGDKNRMGASYGNIGVIYHDQGELDKALEYYVKQFKVGEELNYKNYQSLALGNIGSVYKDKGNYEKALANYLKALKIDEDLGNKNGIAGSLDRIGIIYAEQNNFIKSQEYFLKAMKIAEEIGDMNHVAGLLGNMGELCVRSGDYKKAFDFTFRSLAIDDENGSLDKVKADYEILSDLYTRSKVPLPDSVGGKILNKEQMRLKALLYLKRSVALRDTIFSEENKKQLIQKEMNFEFEKKEAAAKFEQDKKDAVAQEELKRKEQQRNYFIAGFALVLILAGFIFRSFRQKQKANIEITHQKHLVEEKQKEILDSIHYAKRIQTALITPERYIGSTIDRLNR